MTQIIAMEQDTSSAVQIAVFGLVMVFLALGALLASIVLTGRIVKVLFPEDGQPPPT